MNEKISSILKEYGLDDNEIKIYLYLVTQKQLTAYKIAKDLHIHRSNCYNILDRLEDKGFISKNIFDNKRVYSTNELSRAIGRIKSKESLLTSLIPEIRELEAKEKTVIKYSDTHNSFAEIDTRLYQLAKEGKLTFTYMISNSPDLTTPSSRILIERLFKELTSIRPSIKIDGRGIWDKKFKNHKFLSYFSKLGKNKFLEKLPNQATTFIYDEHIAFVFLSEEDSFIEIKNKKISEEMKTYFEYLWSIAKD